MSKVVPFQHDFETLKKARDATAMVFKKVTNDEYENVLLNRIVQLETKILEQEDFIKDLMKDPTGHGWVFPYQWQLTGKEAKMLMQLASFEIATKENLYRDLYSGAFSDKDLVEIKIIDVFICKLRKKLPFSIETIWGRGYRIDSEIRKGLKEKFYFSVEIDKSKKPSLKDLRLDD